MQAFAALLDRLVYTPGRNAKLRLIGDYLHSDARSGSRLGAGGADRRARSEKRQTGADP